MRLIDADKFAEVIIDRMEKIKERYSFDSSEAGILSGAYKLLQSQPTIEPQRINGRWQEVTASVCSGYDPVLAGYDDPVVGYICSICHEGYEKDIMGKSTWNYCPNCGADMREE